MEAKTAVRDPLRSKYDKESARPLVVQDPISRRSMRPPGEAMTLRGRDGQALVAVITIVGKEFAPVRAIEPFKEHAGDTP
jgi:hypothetical protein